MSVRVLLVEDDARLAGMVADYLGEAGIRSAIAGTGREASSISSMSVPPSCCPHLPIY